MPQAHRTCGTRGQRHPSRRHTLRSDTRHVRWPAAEGACVRVAPQKGPPHGTGGPSGQIFNQRRNPGGPECEHRWVSPQGPPRFSMAPSRQGSSVRGRGREPGTGQNAGEKQPTRRREKAQQVGTRLSDTSSRIRGHKRPGHMGCMMAFSRAAVPVGERLPRATRTAAAHGRGCTSHQVTLLELATQASAPPSTQNHPQAQGSGHAFEGLPPQSGAKWGSHQEEGRAERTHCARDPSASPFDIPRVRFPRGKKARRDLNLLPTSHGAEKALPAAHRLAPQTSHCSKARSPQSLCAQLSTRVEILRVKYRQEKKKETPRLASHGCQDFTPCM